MCIRNAPTYSAAVTTRYNYSNRRLRAARRVSVLYDSHKGTAIIYLTTLELVFLKVRSCVLCEVETEFSLHFVSYNGKQCNLKYAMLFVLLYGDVLPIFIHPTKHLKMEQEKCHYKINQYRNI